MLLIFELIFIVLLAAVLYMLYRIERVSRKDALSKASAEEYWKGKERRQHVRFRQTLPVVYILEKNHHLKKDGSTVDISQGGMKLSMTEKLEPGTLLDIMIDLPPAGETAEIECEVVWTEENPVAVEGSGKRFFHSGVKFSAVKEPFGKRLSDYLSTLAADKGE